MRQQVRAAALAFLAATRFGGAADLPLAVQRFALDEEAEVVATLRASCAACAWGRPGREAAVLRLLVDGRYSQHVVLVRGADSAEYAVALGRLRAGAHELRIELDRERTPRAVREVEVAGASIESTLARDARHELLAHAPVLELRPNALERFSDLPLVMWVEQDATPRGRRLRYSVVFSNEDGGTPSDRLMATWGRLTDIEYVYGVELDAQGKPLAAEYQGRDHEIRPFAGAREASHPVLYVTTENNMLGDTGEPGARMAPVALPFDLAGVSREAVMDAHPWTYRVSSEEARREGRVRATARPGDKAIPDPRRFVYLEACAEGRDAALSFGVGVSAGRREPSFFDSDGGRREFRIVRSPDHFPNGCFRGAVALPEGTRPGDLRALRVRAFTRSPAKHEAALPSGAGWARLRTVNALFLLGSDDLPRPSLFSWRGDVALTTDGAAHELEIGGKP
jgi:hypothetical protein